MTVLLVLLFISTFLLIDFLREWKRKHHFVLGDVFSHDYRGQMIYTMADGGQKTFPSRIQRQVPQPTPEAVEPGVKQVTTVEPVPESVPAHQIPERRLENDEDLKNQRKPKKTA